MTNRRNVLCPLRLSVEILKEWKTSRGRDSGTSEVRQRRPIKCDENPSEVKSARCEDLAETSERGRWFSVTWLPFSQVPFDKRPCEMAALFIALRRRHCVRS